MLGLLLIEVVVLLMVTDLMLLLLRMVGNATVGFVACGMLSEALLLLLLLGNVSVRVLEIACSSTYF